MNHKFAAAIVALLAAVVAVQAFADVRVRGYYRKDGTYVRPHYRSNPDGNFWNNWSTKGNVNPYTGKPGTQTAPPPAYGADVRVEGYYRNDGTYVAPHYRSTPDGKLENNWSTQGNVNPYTGRPGTRINPLPERITEQDDLEEQLRQFGYVEPLDERMRRFEERERLAQEKEREKRERAAESKFHIAKQFYEQGKPDLCKKWLLATVAEYGETKAAGEAKAVLERMGHKF